MQRPTGTLRQMCLEMLGLTVAMSLVIIIAAFNHFGGLRSVTVPGAFGFSVVILFLTALPIQAYAMLRIARLQALNSHLHQEATRDGLTHVLNRNAFRRAAELRIALIGRRRQAERETSALLIIDADQFKKINDRLGHAAGDQALKAIAAVLQQSVGEDDLVGRVGGEEFAILLRHGGVDEAISVGDRIRAAVEEIGVGARAHRMPISVSIGGVIFASRIPYDFLYRAADTNLMRGKKAGRGGLELSNFVREVRRPGDNTGATRALSESSVVAA